MRSINVQAPKFIDGVLITNYELERSDMTALVLQVLAHSENANLYYLSRSSSGSCEIHRT
jgi:hypothetical protein